MTFPVTHKLPLWDETPFPSTLLLYREERQGSTISCFTPTALLEEGLFWRQDGKDASGAQPTPAPRQLLTPAKQACYPASKHLSAHGNTPLPPHPQHGVSEAGTEPMLRDEWHPACCCPYHLETAAGGLPGVWTPVKLSVSFLTGPWDNYSG